MTILITGAESFVGRELIAQCRERGIAFAGIDAVASSAGTIAADIRDRALADRLPDGIDTVVHLAAVSRDPDCRRDPVACYDVNVAGTINVFEAARARGARQFIFASTEWVYDCFVSGRPKTEDDPIDWTKLTSDYALSKIAAEHALRLRHLATGLPVTVLRFGIIYGPRADNWSAVEALLAKVAAGEKVEVGARATARCFIHVADIARGILASRGRDGYDVINLQGNAPITLGHVIETSAQLLEIAPQVVETSPFKPNISNVSNAKAKVVLGWQPQIGLAEGLRSVAEFLELSRQDLCRSA